ncbi:subtilisin-like protease SBT3 [Diospyros lotus]|uniref:subtilisin-like protease SBT3 n=1 Tax=Diospyros lotus TaxID=55363 RepID=UPI0022588E36|nr:subtilisin-like protease SBT3 [Diospyros lotus]
MKIRFLVEFSLLYHLTWFLFLHHVRSVSPQRSTYIVHMDKSLMPKVFATHHHWYSSTVDSSKAPNPPTVGNSQSTPSLVYTYDNVVQGFSARLSLNELESIKNSPGFVSAYPDREIKHRTTHTPQFLSLNPSTGIWPASNYGKDVIIGIVDTGVWPENLSFKDDGMGPIPTTWKGICEVGQEFNTSVCNSKLIGARYFNKGLLAANPNLTISMNSARDTSGHGTHTASTAAGNYVEGASFFGYAAGTAVGIAPRARLAIYKVIWDEGAQASDFLAGIDQAVADGVHVVSLSLGFDYDLPFYENTIAISSFGAMEQGVLVSHAGGNTGPGFASLFDSIPWTLTVAAGNIDRSFAGTLTLGNGLSIIGWTIFPANAFVEKAPLIYNKTLASCNSTELLAQAPYGIIICEDINSSDLQLDVISASNVAAAIFISDSPVWFEINSFPWPGVMISPNDGVSVIKYAKTSKNPLANIRFKETILGGKPAPTVASYSSRGPPRSYPGILKPDLMAPGSLVLASWIPMRYAARIGLNIKLANDYNLLTGTSMACPHASGVAALLKGSHPQWSASAIRSAMMTTASPLDNTNNPIRVGIRNHSFASPLDVGSGHIDPNRALDPGLIYDITPKEYVNLLCYMNYTEKQIMTMTRSNLYNCSQPSADLNYPSFIALYPNKTATTTLVQTFRRTVTNVGDGVTTYSVEVIAPAGSRVTISPTKLVFRNEYETKSYNLTIKYESDNNAKVTHGSIVWVEDNGKHTVRSPIVVSPQITL